MPYDVKKKKKKKRTDKSSERTNVVICSIVLMKKERTKEEKCQKKRKNEQAAFNYCHVVSFWNWNSNAFAVADDADSSAYSAGDDSRVYNHLERRRRRTITNVNHRRSVASHLDYCSCCRADRSNQMDTVQDRRRRDVRDHHRYNMLSDDCAVVVNRSFELAVVAVDHRSVEIEANQMDSAADDGIEKSVVVVVVAKMKMMVAMNDEMRK